MNVLIGLEKSILYYEIAGEYIQSGIFWFRAKKKNEFISTIWMCECD